MEQQNGRLDVRLEDVVGKDLFPKDVEERLERLGQNADGTVWFKDLKTLTCYRFENTEGKLRITETRELKASQVHKPKTVTVECQECGAERVVATQDAFQVKRCQDCQRKHRNHKRNERAKTKRKETTTKKTLETLNEGVTE